MTGGFIFVVGMHRSGTSAVTGSLVKLRGATQDRNAVDSNPQGQWERPELRPHLEALLAFNGATWRRPPPAQRPTSAGLLDAPLRRAFATHHHPQGIWKDPRLCLTFDYWSLVASDLGFDRRVVFVHREPLRVAESLRERNGWSIERGLALWERTNRNAIARLAGTKVFAISYAEFVARPDETLRSMSREFALDVSDERLAQAVGTVHSARDISMSEVDPRVSDLCPTQAAISGLHNELVELVSAGGEPPEVASLLGQATPAERVRAVVRGFKARASGT